MGLPKPTARPTGNAGRTVSRIRAGRAGRSPRTPPAACPATWLCGYPYPDASRPSGKGSPACRDRPSGHASAAGDPRNPATSSRSTFCPAACGPSCGVTAHHPAVYPCHPAANRCAARPYRCATARHRWTARRSRCATARPGEGRPTRAPGRVSAAGTRACAVPADRAAADPGRRASSAWPLDSGSTARATFHPGDANRPG